MKTTTYCKAYYARDLKKFSHWAEICEQSAENVADEAIVYLRDDFTVVKNPARPDAGIILHTVTPEWSAFCQQTLQFALPAGLEESEHE